MTLLSKVDVITDIVLIFVFFGIPVLVLIRLMFKDQKGIEEFQSDHPDNPTNRGLKSANILTQGGAGVVAEQLLQHAPPKQLARFLSFLLLLLLATMCITLPFVAEVTPSEMFVFILYAYAVFAEVLLIVFVGKRFDKMRNQKAREKRAKIFGWALLFALLFALLCLYVFLRVTH